MSMPGYALHDFIATVPICVHTSPFAFVLEIFSQGKCDRLAVVSEQQNLIGIVNLRHLMPQIMTTFGRESNLDVQQPLCDLEAVVEPIATLPAALSVEQFRLYLRSQQLLTKTDFDWALIDAKGKFMGLLDCPRLLQFLAISPAARENALNQREPLKRQVSLEHRQVASANENGVVVLNSLVQLLETLPLPLMLQTSSGEVVTQNPAWQQQFGSFAPESVTQEVKALLASEVKSQESNNNENALACSDILNPIVQASLTQESQQRKHLNPANFPSNENSPHFNRYIVPDDLEATCNLTPDASASASNTVVPTSTQEDNATSLSHCQLGTQPNTCICALPVKNGQERIWEFVKISLGGERQEASEKIALPLLPDLWLLLATDVTEQQQLASELAAKNADLIGLNRLKDEFLACISHELKTPITAVMGLSTLLKDQTLGQLNERQARYAGLIHQSGRHLMSVVNDILDLTRMETGQLNLSLEPVQIRTVCDRSLKQARAMQSKSSSLAETLGEAATEPSFTLSIEPGLDMLVADELRLRQMLVHLLTNAFKFTQVSGEIGLRVNHWEGWIAFTVWDTGIGIPEQQQHLIFQKFQQLENPLTRQFEGTGLGLVLTRALARLHGGDVSFLSKEGKGSSFTLLLPPNPPHKRAEGEEKMGGQGDSRHLVTLSPCPSTPIFQNHRNRLVLVIEAAPRFIENLTQQLTNLGYRFVIARSGTEALEKARRLQPGAIFLNPLLPLLSGWDVLTLLKSDPVASKIPIIVTATIAEKEQAFSNRADEFLSLPIQQQALQQILSRFCPIPSSPSSNLNAASNSPLTILRLVNSLLSVTRETPTRDWLPLNPHSTLNYRVLEADDLEQAELLAKVWQPDVVLLDPIPEPVTYLKQLMQCSGLTSLPLVTLDAASMQAAQATGLSVFPYLPSTSVDVDALLSVLQIAAGRIWKARVLVVDVATLPDLKEVDEGLENHSSLSLGCECQALIQYLETAGFTGVIGNSWAEVLQQIEQQSVDLMLIYLADATRQKSIVAALKELQQPHIPPVLVLDQRLSQEVRHSYSKHTHTSYLLSTADKVTSEPEAVSQESVLGAMSTNNPLCGYATKILPSSLAMEELLDHIYQTLALCGRYSV